MVLSPTYPSVAIYPHLTHQQTGPGYQNKISNSMMGLVMFDHCGTHVDAFTHIDPSPSAESRSPDIGAHEIVRFAGGGARP
jgi:kynurenine formamidase